MLDPLPIYFCCVCELCGGAGRVSELSKQALEEGLETCLATFILDGLDMKHLVAQPQLNTLDAMCDFVCTVAESISQHIPD